MKVWRLTRPQYVAAALTGEGSAQYPGRWNVGGHRVVYASESLSLAVLEVVVHAETSTLLDAYVALQLEVPDDGLETVSLDELPLDWQSYPAPESTRRLGSARLGHAGALGTADTSTDTPSPLALRVPSALVAVEYNVVIDTRHVRFGEVTKLGSLPFPFDARLLAH